MMKSRSFFRKFIPALAAVMFIFGCKSTDWSKVTYQITPNPLELHGDSVAINVKGTIPAKAFAKKEIVTVTPSIKWEGGQKELKPITFQGEKIKEGNATVVARKNETFFNYTDRVAYQPEMKVSQLAGKAVTTSAKGKEKKTFDMPGFADATITTPRLVMSDEKPLMGKEAMPRTVPMSAEADIHFVISRYEIRDAEIKMQDMADLLKFFIESQTAIMDESNPKKPKVTGYTKNYDILKVNISAYASPDGETSKNANLAADRGKETQKYLASYFRKNDLGFLVDRTETTTDAKGKTKETKTNIENELFSVQSTPEDWDGFQRMMQESNVPDKEMILRILNTYSDSEKREKEIKNISKAYTEIADQILPKLRRSKITVSGEKKCRTDEEISNLASNNPDILTNEELVYAAYLTQDMNQQAAIYTALSRIHPTDWRGPNNLGAVLLMQNKVNEAKAQFEKANQIKGGVPEVLNNLGIIAMKEGDKKKAAELYGQAGGAPEVAYNMARIHILNGKYADAVSGYGSASSFNAALAKLMNGNADGAMSTLEASKDKDSGMGFYLKAVISARKGDTAGVVKHLKDAFAKDASLKSKAKEDMEFLRFKDSAEIKAVLN
jgi:Flp pilus assembly protein TadD